MTGRAVGLLAGTAAVAAYLPALAGIDPLRRALTPSAHTPSTHTPSTLTPSTHTPGLAARLSGARPADRVALTFDDGPDPVSSPQFVELLARHQVHATFFLLADWCVRYPGVVRELSAAGHQLALHGWDHRPLPLKRPGRLRDELARARDVVEDLAGAPVRLYRPPYGVLSTEALLATRGLGLTPLLWSAWGRDWSRRATPESIRATVTGQLGAGGTVLLHDTDRTAAPGSWRRTLAATDTLLRDWSERGLEVGPVGEVPR